MSKTILFVDDEPLIARLYARAAMSLGLDAQFAEDGLLALEAVAHDPPALIISDLNMPGMGGLALIDALIAKQAKTMPVILLSADPGADIIKAGLAHGADDFLLKGISFELVITRIKFWTEAPLIGLPADARLSARKALDRLPQHDDPVLLLQTGRSLLVERASVAVLDQVLAAPPGFGAKTADRERLLGLICGTLMLLSRTDPLALIRQGDHILAVLERLGGDWPRRLHDELTRLDAISQQPTYQHAAQSLMLLP